MPQDPRSDPDSRHLLVSGTPHAGAPPSAGCRAGGTSWIVRVPAGHQPVARRGVDDPGGAEPVRLPSGRHLHPVSGLLTLRCPTGTRAAGSQGRRYGGGRLPSVFPPPDARPHGTAWSWEGCPGTAEAVDRPFAHVSAIVGTKRGCKGTRGVMALRPVKSPALPTQVRILSLPPHLSCGNTVV